MQVIIKNKINLKFLLFMFLHIKLLIKIIKISNKYLFFIPHYIIKVIFFSVVVFSSIKTIPLVISNKFRGKRKDKGNIYNLKKVMRSLPCPFVPTIYQIEKRNIRSNGSAHCMYCVRLQLVENSVFKKNYH